MSIDSARISPVVVEHRDERLSADLLDGLRSSY